MELTKYIYASSGCPIPYFSDKCAKRSKEILVGKDARGISNKLDFTSLSDEGFIIKEIDGDLVIAGKTPRGTMYGVYHLLEILINFRCFTSTCEKFDKKDKIEFDGKEIKFDFPFE